MRIMRIILFMVSATVLVGFSFWALLANLASAAETWDQWGAAPYATSQEEACRKAPEAIDGLNLLPEVKEHFKKVLGTTCKGGTEAWLVPDQRLEQMWSGGSTPHVMNGFPVAELPVLRSPDGRPYPKGSVAQTARALSWEFIHEGKRYVLYLPMVCFNWSWDFAPVRAMLAEEEWCIAWEREHPMPDPYGQEYHEWYKAWHAEAAKHKQ